MAARARRVHASANEFYMALSDEEKLSNAEMVSHRSQSWYDTSSESDGGELSPRGDRRARMSAASGDAAGWAFYYTEDAERSSAAFEVVGRAADAEEFWKTWTTLPVRAV